MADELTKAFRVAIADVDAKFAALAVADRALGDLHSVAQAHLSVTSYNALMGGYGTGAAERHAGWRARLEAAGLLPAA